MGRPHASPHLGPGLPELGVAVGVVDPRFHPDGIRVPPGVGGVLPYLGDDGFRLRIVGLKLGEPAIGTASYPAQHAVHGHRAAAPAAGSHPDGYGSLHRQRVDAGVGDVVISAVEIHGFFGPKPAEQFHLFLGAATPGREIFAQGFVLHMVPAHAHAQAQSAAAEHVDLRRLLGHQGGLTLAKDQDCRHQLDAGGQCRHVTEQHEDFVEQAFFRVSAHPGLMVVGIGAQHVVVGDDVGVTEFFRSLNIIPDCDRV